MADIGQFFSSGNWMAKEGQEEAFIEQWTAFVGWSAGVAEGGFSGVHLIRDIADPQHFISFGVWASEEARDAWRAHDEFGEQISKCVALCDEFTPTDYTLVANPA